MSFRYHNPILSFWEHSPKPPDEPVVGIPPEGYSNVSGVAPARFAWREDGIIDGRLLGILVFFFLLVSPAHAGVQGGAGSCLTEAFGGAVNCTAEDVRIASAETIEVLDACDFEGDTARVKLRVDLVIGAAVRYDLGLFAATDGGDARSGTCFKEYLPPPLSAAPSEAELLSGFGPYYNDAADNDQCGDARQNDALVDPVRRVFSTAVDSSVAEVIEFVCRDGDGDGFLDFEYCAGWRQNSTFTCSSIADAGIPGNASKCKCDTVNLAVAVSQNSPAGLTVVKTVMLAGGTCGVDDAPGPFVASVAASVVYCYAVTAEGTPATHRAVYNVVLVDDMGTPGDASDDQTIVLAPLLDLDGGGSQNDLEAGGVARGQSSVVQVP